MDMRSCDQINNQLGGAMAQSENELGGPNEGGFSIYINLALLTIDIDYKTYCLNL